MQASTLNASIKAFGMNTRGVDYGIGDIHGTYRHLAKRLKNIGFDRDRDRLFPVGDLIDRGPESEWVLDYLGAPFFHPVLGNHELYISKLYAGGVPSPAMLEKSYAFTKSGFEWWRNASRDFRKEFLTRLQAVPAANEIETTIGKIGTIHADVPVGCGWGDLPEILQRGIDDELRKKLFSSRERNVSGDETLVAGIERVYVGHCVVPKVRVLGNIVNLDTGAYQGRGKRWPGDGALSIVRLDTPMDVLRQAIAFSKPYKGLICVS